MQIPNAKTLGAKLILAWALVLKVLQGIFRRPPRNTTASWLEHLREEGIGPVPQTAWSQLAPAGACIGCCLCDAAAPDEGTSPAQLVMGAGRVPADAPLELQRAAALDRVAEDIAQICPARVQARDIADLIRANASVLDRFVLTGASRGE